MKGQVRFLKLIMGLISAYDLLYAHEGAALPTPEAVTDVTKLAESGERKGAKTDEPVVIDAGEIRCMLKENQCTAVGNAHAQRGNLTLKSHEIEAKSVKTAGGRNEISKIMARQGVQILSGDDHMVSDTAEYEAATDVLLLRGRNMMLKTADGHVLTARDLIRYDRKQNVADAVGHVEVTSRRGVIQADAMKAFTKKDARGKLAVERVEANGHVVIITPDEVAKGDQCTYVVHRSHATLAGHVEIFREKHYARGDYAQVDFATGRSLLTHADDAGEKNMTHQQGASEKKGRVRLILNTDKRSAKRVGA